MKRYLSLDIFRGLTVAAMILVNSPGNSHPFYLLDHAAWNGCTVADLVFPFFLFIMGISTAIALKKAKHQLTPNYLLLKTIAKRTIFLFIVGLLLNAFPTHFNFETLRYYGVLQRIALCYFFASVLYMYSSVTVLITISAATLLIYHLIYIITPDYSIAHNPAAVIDQLIFSSNHLYGKVYDPEGFLSTFPSLVTTLIGCLTGTFIMMSSTEKSKVSFLLIAALVSLTLGILWSYTFPLNKALWTSSYVLWTAGWGLLVFAILYYLIEIKQQKTGLGFLKLFGTYALSAYVFHVFFLKIQAVIHINTQSHQFNLREYFTHILFPGFVPEHAALSYAVVYLMFCAAVFYFYDALKKRRVGSLNSNSNSIMFDEPR
jgi:predicted acyltransferase